MHSGSRSDEAIQHHFMRDPCSRTPLTVEVLPRGRIAEEHKILPAPLILSMACCQIAKLPLTVHSFYKGVVRMVVLTRSSRHVHPSRQVDNAMSPSPEKKQSHQCSETDEESDASDDEPPSKQVSVSTQSPLAFCTGLTSYRAPKESSKGVLCDPLASSWLQTTTNSATKA